jgi:hypothetical protein
MKPMNLNTYRAERAARRGDPFDFRRYILPDILAVASQEATKVAMDLPVEAILETIASTAMTLQDVADRICEDRCGGEPLDLEVIQQMTRTALGLVVLSRALEQWARQGEEDPAG